MRILLTGSSGFVGRNLSPLLKEKYGYIECLTSSTDLRKPKNCERILNEHYDAVVHLAGSVGGIGANQKNPGKFLYDNLMMGANLVHSMVSHHHQSHGKLVFVGTVCSYPKHTPVPFKESDIWNGYPEETNAPYGVAKKCLAEMVKAYNDQYGLEASVLIPSNMYGPFDHFNTTSSHVIPALIYKFHRAIENNMKTVTVWGDGNASREFLFVKDFGNAVVKAIETDTGPMPINIGTGVETKISDLVQMISSIMGYKGKIIFDDSKPNGQPRRCLDVQRALDVLDFKASTSLEDGLKQTIDWFLKDGKNE